MLIFLPVRIAAIPALTQMGLKSTSATCILLVALVTTSQTACESGQVTGEPAIISRTAEVGSEDTHETRTTGIVRDSTIYHEAYEKLVRE